MAARIRRRRTVSKSRKAPAPRTGRVRGAAATPSRAAWTLLVYMAGDNNLDDFGASDIEEMKRVGSTDKVNLLVQRDTAAAGVPTRRYRLRQGTTIAADEVSGVSLGETNTGDPRVFAEFLDWGLEHYPAERTMVVLWNHGAGWDDTDVYHEARRRNLAPPRLQPAGNQSQRRSGGTGRGSIPAGFVRRSAAKRRHRGPFFLSDEAFVRDPLRRAIAFDDQAQDFLDNVEIKATLDAAVKKAGGPFDVIGMDACLMAMLETGVQVAGCGRMLCASQEVEPGAGWAYDRFLPALVANPDMAGADLARHVARTFVASYPAGEKATQSVVDLVALDGVRQAADALGRKLTAALRGKDGLAVRGAIDAARKRAQSYENPDYVDLYDFTEQLNRVWKGAAAENMAVQRGITQAVIANHAVHPDVCRSHGLSIHLPAARLSPLYASLVFGKGGWATFLGTFTT